MEKLTGIIVRPAKGAEVVKFEPKLEWYYENLECQSIDITESAIDGKAYDFICDDEGLLKENPLPSACNSKGVPMLYGNILICHHDNEGNETGLTEEEAERIIDKYSLAIMNISDSGISLNHFIKNVEFAE